MLIIFDCDGVLVDSEILSAQVFSECLAEQFDIHVDAEYSLEAYRGKSVADCIQMITEELTQRLGWHAIPLLERQNRGHAFWRYVQKQTLVACEKRLHPVEGIEDVLIHLQAHQVPFCVGSNGKHEKMAVTLAKTNLLQYVQGRIFSFEDVAKGKPAPDLFLHAAHKMNVPATQTIVVEDSLTGIIAAKAAGMRALGYCPPAASGHDQLLANEMAALGAECFSHMNQLVSLIFDSTSHRQNGNAGLKS